MWQWRTAVTQGGAETAEMAERNGTTVLESGPPHGQARPGSTDGSMVTSRRRTLPGGRAVVGGFLVAAAAVGVFAAHLSASAGPTSTYVVVQRDISVGERLTPADLALVALDLPDAQRGRAFTEIAVLDDAVVLARLVSGELVQASAVAEPSGAGGMAQLSFSVRPSDALNGHIKAGERVDLLVVYGTGEAATVRTVATDASVVEAVVPSGGLAGVEDVTVIVALPPDDVEEVALASTAGTLKVVRTTGSARTATEVGGAAP